ncbi:hypothetical protein FB451DRAFT_1036505 [Mycena latifolia]|nr:hypothetical protein FB451DRAFT_1036505 [Mycena latifolia]
MEKGNLNAQLKALRNGSKAKGKEEPPIDAFSNRLDQVSEAHIKSGVESINDSLDNLVMDILEKGEQIVGKHADLVRHFSEREHSNDAPLLASLAQHNLTADNRGLLLDATLHDRLHTELHRLFFSREVVSSHIDPEGMFQAVFDELCERESWTIVQRWRAITATSIFTLFVEERFRKSITDHIEGIITLLAWAYGLSPSEFETMSEMIHTRLVALYKEANELSIQVRRDILSVRMSVISVDAPVFDPDFANSVWPEMGATAGDEIVGRYRFGLLKLLENGEFSCLIMPEVATMALIRETSKNG